ncbi:MAG: fibro-slime domain-containing protein [Ruminococcus sp.]
MYKAIRKAGRFVKKSLSLVLAFSMMISVCMVSVFSVSANSTAGTFEYNAQTDSTSFNDVDYVASCSLYDYLDDQELSSGTWGNVKTVGNSATWYPFKSYNSALSSYYSTNSIKKPLYFGNFSTGESSETDRKNDYNTNKDSLYSYDAAANNSKAVWYDAKTNVNVNDTDWLASCANPDSWAYSYQGVVSKNLGSDGSLQMMKSDDSGTAAAPFFNDSFLSQQYSNTMLGRKVNTVLPFTYNAGTKKYSYQSSTTSSHSAPVNGIYLDNSNRGSSTNNLNGVSADSLTMVYGGTNTSTAILDGKEWFNLGSSGYGFFPFNNNTDSHTGNDVRNDLNYGFGMVLTVDFTVPTNGCVEGTSNPVEFTFTGDDDVWIFIDNKLVVDLGGDHKDASCTLNFKDKTTKYSTGCNNNAVTSASDEYSLADVMNGSTGNTVHTLKMFYMERGLIESNLQVEFSFSPIDNYITTTKTVDTTNVNPGIKSAVSNTDSFTFTNVSNGTSNSTGTALSGKTYMHTAKDKTESIRTSDSSGSYTMKDGETAAFTNITDTGNYITVSEDTSGKIFTYDSTYTVTDVQNGVVKASGSDTSANFLFKNEVSEKQATNYRVDFVNTPQVNNLNVSKTVKDVNGNNADGIDNTKFDFSIALSLDGSDNYKAYPLVYEIGGTQYTAANGRFTLMGGQTAVFNNIPVGTKYIVTEGANNDYTVEPSNRTDIGVIGGASVSNRVAFTNTKIDKSDATVVLQATKLVDGTTPDVNSFEFVLTELSLNNGKLVEGNTIQTKTNFEDKVTFDTLQYEYIEPPTQPTTQPATEPTTEPPTEPATEPTTQVATEPTTQPAANSRVYIKTADGNAPKVYAWGSVNGSNTEFLGGYPGTLASAKSGEYWYVDIDTTGTYNLVISNKDNSDIKTQDLTNLTNDTYVTITSSTDFRDNTTYQTGKSRTGSTYSLKSAANPLLKASSAEKHYYKISENASATDETYFYDSKVYYVVVTVDRSQTPITASAKYYDSKENAIKETKDINPDDVVFNNYHRGSVTVAKKAQNDANVAGTTFGLIKVSGSVNDISAEQLDSIIHANQNILTAVTNADGSATFSDLVIFENGDKQYTNDGTWADGSNYKNGSTTHQKYCLFEYSPSAGYNPTYVKQFFTIPKDGKYNVTLDTVVDGLIVSPDASGSGMNMFFIVGLALLGTGAFAVTGYTLFDRNQRKKRRARYKARH